MQVTLTHTDEMMVIGDRTARIWRGKTADGHSCMAYIVALAIPTSQSQPAGVGELKRLGEDPFHLCFRHAMPPLHHFL